MTEWNFHTSRRCQSVSCRHSTTCCGKCSRTSANTAPRWRGFYVNKLFCGMLAHTSIGPAACIWRQAQQACCGDSPAIGVLVGRVVAGATVSTGSRMCVSIVPTLCRCSSVKRQISQHAACSCCRQGLRRDSPWEVSTTYNSGLTCSGGVGRVHVAHCGDLHVHGVHTVRYSHSHKDVAL